MKDSIIVHVFELISIIQNLEIKKWDHDWRIKMTITPSLLFFS